MENLTDDVKSTLHQVLLCPKGEVDHLLASNTSSLHDLLKIFAFLRRNKTEDEYSNAHRIAEFALNHIVIVTICIIGIIGNVLNLAILSHRSWQIALGRMERFSHSGLIGLAASDLSFCLFVTPQSFVDQHEIGYDTLGFHVLYLTYCDAVISTCVLCSTMLTVALAVGRYFAIIYPIRAREVIGMTFTRRVIGGVVVFSILANLPRYWFKVIQTVKCFDNSLHYYVKDGPMQKREIRLTYLSIYFVAAMCIPFFVLIFCNVYLLKALRQTFETPIQCRPNDRSRDSSFRITLSLLIIIIAFLVLVIPGEVIVFLKSVILSGSRDWNPDRYNLPVAVTGCMQAINFSFNFVLYCAVNTHFRRTIKNMMGCHWATISHRKQGSFRYDSVSMDGSNTMRMSITMATKGQYISSTTDNLEPMSVTLLGNKSQTIRENSESTDI